MSRFVVTVAVVTAFVISAPTAFADEAEDKAAKALEARDAFIMRDNDKSVICVGFDDKNTDDDMKYVAAFKNLTELRIYTNQKITGVGLKHLESCEKLSNLLLFECRIKDEHMKQIGKLKSLRSLTLNGTEITDEGVKELEGLKLIDLKLGDTEITNASLKSIAKIKTLIALNMTKCAIDDSEIAELTALKELSNVVLNGSDVTQKGVAILKKALPECKIQNIANPNPDRVSLTKKDVKGLAQLTGTWKVEKSEPKVAFKQIVFQDNRMIIQFADGSKSCRFRVDSTAKPMKIDEISSGIYDIDGDTLRLCFPIEGFERPKEFKGGDKAVLLTLKKQK